MEEPMIIAELGDKSCFILVSAIESYLSVNEKKQEFLTFVKESSVVNMGQLLQLVANLKRLIPEKLIKVDHNLHLFLEVEFEPVIIVLYKVRNFDKWIIQQLAFWLDKTVCCINELEEADIDFTQAVLHLGHI